ncbi:MAG: hypothetical protein PHU23_09130 [Dehalococcoidales bacterium]|nr:hypothetical protein [Dehalococcoidales bacterium]
MLLEDSPQAQIKAEYATIGANDRERIKRAYPKPTIAKSPAIAENMDIL